MILSRMNITKNQNYYPQTLMYEIKTEHVYEDFLSDKENFDFSNYSNKSKYYDDLNKLLIGKMNGETEGLTTEECFGSKPKIYSFLLENNEHKKAKVVNKNAATAIHNEHKDVSLNNKCIRHSMN